MKPNILLITTRRWFSAARLAMAFSAAGCRVEIACPSDHPAMLTRDIATRYPFRALWPVRSLHSAIRKSRPDLVVPTDEIAATYLYRLYELAPAIDQEISFFVRSLLERSLGAPENFPVLTSRTRLLAAAQAAGVRALPAQNIPDLATLLQWLSANHFPAVLKADGTSGGEGVRVVCTGKEAISAWRKLRAPVGVAHLLKQTGFDRDLHHVAPWTKRRPRTVSIQPFISGQDCNIAVACWQGELLGAISLDVLRAWKPKGPGALVEISESDQMLKAARTVVRQLNLSGLCGFDFMVEDGTGCAYLIEMNAHATQTCHLPFGIPRDLITSLVSAIASRPLPPLNESGRQGIIALFPLAWQSGVSKKMLESTLQDVPWGEPALVEAGFARKDKSFFEKCLHMWTRLNAASSLARESK